MSSYQVVDKTYVLTSSGEGTPGLEIPAAFSQSGTIAPLYIRILNTNTFPIQILVSTNPDAVYPNGLPTDGTPQPGITVAPGWPEVIQISMEYNPSPVFYAQAYLSAAGNVYLTQVNY